MRVRTLEIRWHDSTPIYALDYQPLPAAQLRKILAPRIQRDPAALSLPSPSVGTGTNANDGVIQQVPPTFRMATAGGDNLVRVWMVHPNILPPTTSVNGVSQTVSPHPPRVEFLSTLVMHTATVNVVRFSPSGEYIASGGDDGMVFVWIPTDKPSVSYGSDAANEEAQYGKEFWRARSTLRCTTREVYDLAWSPNSEWIVAGSTDNTARIFNALDGTCLREISEHSHYVQGVAWDPLNEFIATQSSDRSVHVYGINTKRGSFDVHAVGKNARMHVKHSHSRTPSTNTPALPTPQASQPPSSTPTVNAITNSTTALSRPNMARRGSTTSEADSVITSASEFREEFHHAFAAVFASGSALNTGDHPSSSSSSTGGLHLDMNNIAMAKGPPTPTASVVSSSTTAAAAINTMFPPKDAPSSSVRSRRSSFNSVAGTNAPSPSVSSRAFGRSPSPMPPLPAIRTPVATPSWASVKLYGDEGFTNFFRRLTFSPDGALLLTPAGQFDDTSGIRHNLSTRGDDPPVQPRKQSQNGEGPGGGGSSNSNSSSSVFIYSRANFARPPVAHLPGHKTASIAVRFSPVLYELRPNVALPPASSTIPSESSSSVGARTRSRAANKEKEKEEREREKEKEKAREKGKEKQEPVHIVIERGKEYDVEINLSRGVPQPSPSASSTTTTSTAVPFPASTAMSTSVSNPLLHHPTPRSSSSKPPSTSSTPAIDIASIPRPPPSPAPSTSSMRASTPSFQQPSSSASASQTPAPATPSHRHQFSSNPNIELTPTHHERAERERERQIGTTGSVFALPYRMLFAVATQDTVMIYDTQQAGPICMFSNLHYAAFTDVAWAPDGQSLMLASSDGYCSIVIFDEFLPLYHTQQHNLQMQAIASSVSTPQHTYPSLPPLSTSMSNSGAGSSMMMSGIIPTGSASASGSGSLGLGLGSTSMAVDSAPSISGVKRSEPAPEEGLLLASTSAASLPSSSSSSGSVPAITVGAGAGGEGAEDGQPKKKKRRIQPTHLGGVGS